MPHTLYIVATPIGNMEDITYRAVRILKEVPLRTGRRHAPFAHPLRHIRDYDSHGAYHDSTGKSTLRNNVEYLQNEGDIALVSDAGTPGIADPAFNLVRECVRNGIDVRAIPGCCAMVAALVSSGMPTDHFTFQYFSPKKSAQRIHLLEKLKDEEATQIFYASPHNIDKFVEEIGQVYGNIKIALMRELTKKFEEHLIGTPEEITAHFKAHRG
jgi:Predicted methyltransferases